MYLVNLTITWHAFQVSDTRARIENASGSYLLGVLEPELARAQEADQELVVLPRELDRLALDPLRLQLLQPRTQILERFCAHLHRLAQVALRHRRQLRRQLHGPAEVPQAAIVQRGRQWLRFGDSGHLHVHRV